MTVETLTAEERRWLETDPEYQKWDVRRKVLRIIDAHAADRAGLERELREVERENALDIRYLRDVAESQITQLQRDRESLVARVALLLRERDEARADLATRCAAAESLAAEWQQTARDAQADLAVLRTENEKLIARFPRG